MMYRVLANCIYVNAIETFTSFDSMIGKVLGAGQQKRRHNRFYCFAVKQACTRHSAIAICVSMEHNFIIIHAFNHHIINFN